MSLWTKPTGALGVGTDGYRALGDVSSDPKETRPEISLFLDSSILKDGSIG